MNPGSSLTSRLRSAALQLFVSINGPITDDLNARVVREIARHSHRVAWLSYCMACAMINMAPNDWGPGEIRPKSLLLAGWFHDLGKAGIPARIEAKPGSLDEAEYAVMKAHPLLGAQLIDQVALDFPESRLVRVLRDAALYHHERWDGAGYPDGLRGESIPLAARLVAIADVYDAIRFARVYKIPRPKSEAVQTIVNGAGSQFDPRLTRILVSVVAHDR
jgi:HD-GYP domain-containing protein (c-di-GMP phosphodiesterase class II)